MLNKLYLALGFGVVLFYAVTAFFGHEYGSSQKRYLPNELRSESGIRSHGYWHDGYHGGK